MDRSGIGSSPETEKDRGERFIPDLDGALEVRANDAARVAGHYGRAGSLVSFESDLGADKVTVRLQVNSVTLEASRDLLTNEVVWTGYDAALFPADRKALIAFSRNLQKDLALSGRELAPHEDLLHRLSVLWAEAPVGLVLGERRVVRRDDRGIAEILKAGDAPRPAELTSKACYIANDNGIAYFGCSLTNRTMCHDQDNGGHCWACASLQSGCGGECLGECGPGCNGLNIYTYDCGDHDRCCRVHGGCWNPWDGECGDEFFDAEDDTLLGWPNCSC